jgi:ATP-dependent DNA helicase RecQ
VELTAALKRIFGFDGFRSGQEAVVRDAMAGRDVLALMPTGGGKSLCFQLPAMLQSGVTLVVSPLIALMQDRCGCSRTTVSRRVSSTQA